MKNKVEPIRSKESISALEKYLAKRNLRNRLIFVLGTNSGLRVSDILKLDVGDVRDKTHLDIREQKTGKHKKFPLNNKLKLLLNQYIDDMEMEDYEPLLRGRKNKRLTRTQVYRMLNDACYILGLDINVGTHTMRKSFGYHHYKQFKDVAMLQTIFNHSSPSVTLHYIGINQDEIDKSYSQFEL